MIVTSHSPYLAVVPARGGSKQLPRKNLRLVAGRPLLTWTIAHVRSSSRRLRLVVSTDDAEIAKVAAREGAEVVERPPALARDESPTEAALLHALTALEGASEAQHLVLLQCTSPVREPGSLDAAIRLYESSSADSLVSVSPVTPLQWAGDALRPRPLYDVSARPPRQLVSPEQARFVENGSIVISRIDGLLKTRNRLHGRVVMYEMGAHEAVDIDTDFDLWLAGRYLEDHHSDDALLGARKEQ